MAQLQQSLNQMLHFFLNRDGTKYFVSRSTMNSIVNLSKWLINEFSIPNDYFFQDLGLNSDTRYISNSLTEWQSGETLNLAAAMLRIILKLLDINQISLVAEESVFLDVKTRLIPLWQYYVNYVCTETV